MTRAPTYLDLWRIGFDSWRMAAEAQMIMSLRLAGMAGFWTLAPGESTRMVQEKQQAFARSALGGMAAIIAAQRWDQVMSAAMQPIARRTRANARRLSQAATRQMVRERTKRRS